MKPNHTTAFREITVPCCGGLEDTEGCICGHAERVLRAYMRQDPAVPPMSVIHREWCLLEIRSVEGFDEKDYLAASDADLARGVLDAWVSFCRDKGFL